MSRECESCGKKTTFGNTIARRGLPKYKGGVGLKTTGISRRRFKPNVQRIRVLTSEGSVRRMKVCTKCIRSGKVRKPVRREIPEGLRARMRAKEELKSPEARRRKKAEQAERRRKRRAEAAARAAAKQG
ncbi:MAG: 50S ribosomal protein L28 [Planctomycetota bacterium]|nr:MAG: 50S ribosomal protein L28 [Planctomycetota bacterium]